MKAGIKKLWLSALRSGKYKQGAGCLKPASGGYCCLGVLCDLYLKGKKRRWKKDTDGDSVIDGELAHLPKSVMAWAGLKIHNPVIPYVRETLASLNDDNTPFTEIADIIEADL